MKKKLIIVNGTMGVGKTTTCRLLNKKLPNSVWLDGDWCWQINPFIVNEENKRMVEDHIRYLLRGFLNNTTIEYVIFSWLIHREDIMDIVVNMVNDLSFHLHKITLTASKEVLSKRIQKDIEEGLRSHGTIEASFERLPLYQNQQTIKIDNTHLSVEETVEEILDLLIEKNRR